MIFGHLVPRLAGEFNTIHTTAVAALSVAILGTLLNDGGITIWYTMTAAIAISVTALWVDTTYQGALPAVLAPLRRIEVTICRTDRSGA